MQTKLQAEKERELQGYFSDNDEDNKNEDKQE